MQLVAIRPVWLTLQLVIVGGTRKNANRAAYSVAGDTYEAQATIANEAYEAAVGGKSGVRQSLIAGHENAEFSRGDFEPGERLAADQEQGGMVIGPSEIA